eukprot:PITA_31683
MLAKASGRPKVEIPLYEGNLNVEELIDWSSALDKYFDYEEVEDKKKVKFAATRLKGHVAICLLSLKTIEGAYHATFKAEEKLLRTQSQRNRGKNPTRGRGASRPRFQHSPNEIGGTSSQPLQRGDFGRGRFESRGRSQGREIRCYTCGELGHGSHNKPTNSRNVNMAETKEESPQVTGKEEPPKVGESLLLKRVLLKAEKEANEPTQRKSILKTVCKSKEKCCEVVINSGSTDNLVSTEMVEKLGLVKIVHPTPYKVSWLQKGHQFLVTE